MFREGLRPPDPFGASDPVRELATQDGMSLHALRALAPVLVVFLPEPPGRRTLRDLAARRRGLEDRGLRLVLVHPRADEEAAAVLAPYGLHYVARIADPDGLLLRAFDVDPPQPGLWARIAGRGRPAAVLLEAETARPVDYTGLG